MWMIIQCHSPRSICCLHRMLLSQPSRWESRFWGGLEGQLHPPPRASFQPPTFAAMRGRQWIPGTVSSQLSWSRSEACMPVACVMRQNSALLLTGCVSLDKWVYRALGQELSDQLMITRSSSVPLAVWWDLLVFPCLSSWDYISLFIHFDSSII